MTRRSRRPLARSGSGSTPAPFGRAVWTVLAADLLSAVGTGMTLPFLVIYLHQERGLALSLAGTAAACVALASLVGNPVGGALADRLGPRGTLAAGMCVAAAGALALAGAQTGPQAIGAALLAGFGAAILPPALDALLAGLTPRERRTTVFGLEFATMNAGMAAGAGLAGILVARPDPAYQALYLLDAASFVIAAMLLTFTGPDTGTGARVRAAGAPGTDAGPGNDMNPGNDMDPTASAAPQGGSVGDGRAGGGYRTVVRDRTFRHLWIFTAILIAVGYGQFNAALPIIVSETAGISANVVGLVFVANMVSVVALQPIVLRLPLLGRPGRALTGVAVAWSATWIVVLIGGRAGHGTAVVLFVLAAAVFAVGETLLAPTLPALVNALAPESLRGRYNAGSALAYTVGFSVGPAIAGLALDSGADTALLVGLTSVCVVLAHQAGRLARRLPRPARHPLSPPTQPTAVA